MAVQEPTLTYTNPLTKSLSRRTSLQIMLNTILGLRLSFGAVDLPGCSHNVDNTQHVFCKTTLGDTPNIFLYALAK